MFRHRSLLVVAITALLFAISSAGTVDVRTDARLSGLVTVPVAAQNGGGGGLTCGWCEDGEYLVERVCDENGCTETTDYGHWFPNGGDECGWPPGEGECSACGGISTCHDDPDPDGCHSECGGGGGTLLAAAAHGAAIGDLEASIRRADAKGILRVLRTVEGIRFGPGPSVLVAPLCSDAEGVTSRTYQLRGVLATRIADLVAAQE